jgi:hypothetical protein
VDLSYNLTFSKLVSALTASEFTKVAHAQLIELNKCVHRLRVGAHGFAVFHAKHSNGSYSHGEALQVPGIWNPIRRIKSENLPSVRSLSKTGSELSSIKSGFPSSYAFSSHPKALSLSAAAA